MTRSEGARIIELVDARRYEDALGVEVGAPLATLCREHVRMLHRYRARPLVRESLNRAKHELAAETDPLRGERLLTIGRSREALDFLTRAARARPSAHLHQILGRAYCRLSRQEEALEHLGRAVVLRGDFSDHHWLGRALESLDRPEQALEHFLPLARDRGDVVDHHWAGLSLMALARYSEALVHLERASILGNDPLDQQLVELCTEKMTNTEDRTVFDKLIDLVRK